MLRTAIFSTCRKYRYTLTRIWEPKKSFALFVCLNPSTADESQDDPTVRRCKAFASRWNHGGLVIVNLFAYRSTDPAGLLEVRDPIGPENDKYILSKAHAASRIILAWGTKGSLLERDQHVLALLSGAYCLGVTKFGHPKHPLYLPSDARVRPFQIKSTAA